MTDHSFDYKQYRLAPNGEAYRRLHVYLTQIDGVVDRIETCEPFADSPSDEALMADLHGFLDVYRDGSCIFTVNYAGNEDAIIDLNDQYESLMPYDEAVDGRFVFADIADRTHFLILCGG